MRTQLREFTKVHTRELLRDRATVTVVLTSFLAMLGLFWLLDLVISAAAGAPTFLLKTSLPLISTIGLMGIALAATTVPLAKYRSLGTLRQLSTTPARTAAFMLGHVPIRVAIVAAECLFLGAVLLFQDVELPQTLQAVVTLLLGGIMLLSLGYVLAARIAHANVALQLSYLLPMFVFASSGALFPLSTLPSWLESVCHVLPTTWFVDALNAQITGSAPALPLGVTWLLLALAATAFAALAARLMRLG